MYNPFEIIETRLTNIENLVLDLKHSDRYVLAHDNFEDILDVTNTSKLLNLKVATIYSKVSKGELPVMKRGKRLYFSRTELLAYLKDGRKKSNAEIELRAEAYLKNKKT